MKRNLFKNLLTNCVRRFILKDSTVGKGYAMNKTVLVTGASRGIGAAIAGTFAQMGYQTAINYCSHPQQAEQLVSGLTGQGLRAAAFGADVSDREQVARMFSEIKREFGGVDILVNNAGVAQQKLFTDITEEEWDRLFAVNVKGAFFCCQEALPHMIHHKRGKIVNISSIWGLTGASCEVHYSASKAALIGLTKALAKELGPSGIQVNCVAPGVIDTEMNAALDAETIEALKEETPLGTLGTGRDIAETVAFLASDRADFITGQTISPNGGFVI
ncbi:oxidoreductase, short chain dehydrogenase/reductase family protein [[Clostridium] methylpentosum DSM 5476]|uniref:Oxidoreductase, short chain dehydrogenase/reductase family protein n=1 Tax=[Clostridium] methylpentosum DSM 5476 TaxID=537013 RepID=C0EII3_9FIRM|nr:oxidoreductase, short chain dehydrogenase/reductase family protein [[Clostridium] methylpentosum DSM 5476]